MSWNDDLNGTALNIAATHDSPLRVMAGPGTGKSFALKRRVARLLEEGADPERILVVTFTRNAAASLVKDLSDLGVPGCDRIRAGTLHAFCYRLLREEHVFNFLGRVARPLITFPASGVLQYEGGCLLDDLQIAGNFGHKRNCTKRIRAFEAAWARLQSDTPGWPLDPVDKAFHAELLRWLSFHHGMLIGELVPEALRYLRGNPTAPVLQAFDHVIVDEYQDLNRAEQELIDMLSANGATAIVGDVDQSIYRFRHANPEGITNFNANRPATHDESLTECRRCPRSVVAIADSFIRHNHDPAGPARLNPLPTNPPGIINIVQWDNVEAEAQGLADHIAWLIEQQHYGPGEILVLTPRRLLGYAIRDKLEERTIAVHSFYHEEALESENAQRALALILLLADNEDRIALRWWLADGSPSGRREAYGRLRTECQSRGLSPWAALTQLEAGAFNIPHTGDLLQRFTELKARLAAVAGMDLSAVVEELIPAAADGCEALREAAQLVLEEAESIDDLAEALQSAVSQPELPEEGDYVRVMSLHKSKGLTSRAVIVAGCVQGLIPFQDDASTPDEREEILKEQRRLFYVAVTRCTERLVISSFARIHRKLAHKIGARTVWGPTPTGRTVASEFLQELGPSSPVAQTGGNWQATGYA